MATNRVRQVTAGGTLILQFPPLTIAPDEPRCLWCRDAFTLVKPNQMYCKPKHRQYACECRKAALGTAVAALLEQHGASPQCAQDAAIDVIEAFYRTGRVQSAVTALGWTYDELGKVWRTA